MSTSTSATLHKRVSVPATYILLLLLIAGAFLRFFNLTYTGLWLDEIYSMKAVVPGSSISDIYEYSKHDQPPIFFLLLHGWLKLFGYSDFSGRALMCTFGLLGIIAIYFLGREVGGQRVGIFCAFITTLNWFHVGISTEMRFYALLFLLSTLSYLFFLRALKTTKIVDLALYAIVTSLTLNTHYFGMVLFLSQVIIFILNVIFFERRVQSIAAVIVAGAIAGLSLLHWLPVILHDLQISSFHVKPHTARYLGKFLWWYFYDPAALFIYMLFGFLALREIAKKITEKRFEKTDLVVTGWLVVGFAIPIIYSLTKMPLLTNKYCTIQVPVLFLIIAQGLALPKFEKVKPYLITVVVLSAFFVLLIARPQYKKSFHEDGREIAIMYFTSKDADKKSWNEDWKEVAEYFAQHDSTNRVIFSQLAWFHEYYFKKNNLKPPIDQNNCDFKTQIENAEQVWLLLHDHYKDSSPFIKFSAEQDNILEDAFFLSDSVRFRKSKAFLFARKNKNLIVTR